MYSKSIIAPMALTLAFLAGSVSAASLQTFTSVSADTAADLQPTVDAFREALGPNNGNAPVNSDPNGRRQINWDAAPDAISDPNPFPGEFFNGDTAPRARGIEFEATGYTTGFQLSSTEASGEPVGFGFPSDFVPFSPERMFTPVGGNTFTVNFFDPADQVTPALSRGLGVIFNDVELADTTSMTLFDRFGNSLASAFAQPGQDQGLSFLGFIFDEAVIASAAFTVGSRVFDGTSFGGSGDAVVMDDFIFGEPVPQLAPVPLPASLPALLSAFALFAGLRARAQG